MSRVFQFVPPARMVVLSLFACFMVACASQPRQGTALAPVRQAVSKMDEFGTLLLMAGVPPDVTPTGDKLTPQEAELLHQRIIMTPFVPLHHGPRRVALTILEVVAKGEAPVTMEALSERIQPFRSLYVFFPDGYLVPTLAWPTVDNRVWLGDAAKPGALGPSMYDVNGFYQQDAEKTGWMRVEFNSDPKKPMVHAATAKAGG